MFDNKDGSKNDEQQTALLIITIYYYKSLSDAELSSESVFLLL